MKPIERYLHQIWIQGKDHIPEYFSLYRKKWKEFHPNTEIILWDGEMIELMIKNDFPWLLESWNKINKLIVKVDFAKILILYKYGGWYCDMDTEPLKDIRNLFKDYDLVLCKTYIEEAKIVGKAVKVPFVAEYLINNAFMASIPQHPFWLQIMQELPYNVTIPMKNYIYPCWVANIAGPEVICRNYHSFINTYPSLSSKIKIYDHTFFEPRLKFLFYYTKTRNKDSYYILQNTHSIHYYNKSWLKDDINNYAIAIVTVFSFTLAVLILIIIIIIAIVWWTRILGKTK
jgi:mannosyltransferase OCH1-like enzyme